VNNNLIKKMLIHLFPSKTINLIIDFYALYCMPKKGLLVNMNKQYFEIKDQHRRCIRISRKHNIYLKDIFNSFEYYFTAVYPIELNGISLVDYSTPRFHEINGYGLHPVIFPSLAEPLITTEQYLDFAKLEYGSIVLDLGAYSGFTSIIFDQVVGQDGRVIAVDADQINIKCIKKNFSLYEKIAGRKIELLEGAVWENTDGVMFSSEGNMGSSVSNIIGEYRGESKLVPTFTLNAIAKKFNLPKVDFIKCDIEGAEAIIFMDTEFFEKYQPRIIIETHIIDNVSTLKACTDTLSKFGYKCKEILQYGVSLTLIECEPAN
jgi:FkbM family methyltransferase